MYEARAAHTATAVPGSESRSQIRKDSLSVNGPQSAAAEEFSLLPRGSLKGNQIPPPHLGNPETV